MLVRTPVGELFVEEAGEGPPVLMWHSLLCDGRMWRPQVEALRGRFRLIVVDGPGHGRSERLRRPITMDGCVEAAEAILDARGCARAGVCGLSWGGMVGMRLAARRPERVGALALLATSARAERPAKKLSYRPLSLVTAALGPIRLFGPVLERIFFAERTRAERRDVVDGFVDAFLAMDRESIGHAVDAVVYRRTDVTAELPGIRAPTLVLVGEHDLATPPDESERIASAIAGARLVRVPDAGHLCCLEQPRVVSEELTRLFDASLG